MAIKSTTNLHERQQLVLNVTNGVLLSKSCCYIVSLLFNYTSVQSTISLHIKSL